MLVNLSCWTGCLDEVSYKQSSLVKNTFLITCKSCPFPVRRHIFHKRDLAFINEGSCFSQMIFSHVIESSRPSGTKQMLMRMLKACKQSLSRSKLDFFFFTFYFYFSIFTQNCSLLSCFTRTLHGDCLAFVSMIFEFLEIDKEGY